VKFNKSKPFHRRNTATGVSRTVHTTYGSWSDWGKLTEDTAKRDGRRCFDCGESDPSKGFETHHIIPLSRGGTNSSLNRKYLCYRCHDRKHPHHSISRGAASKNPFSKSPKTAAQTRAKRFR